MLENPNFEQHYWSRLATGIYRIGHAVLGQRNGSFVMIDPILKL